MQRRIPMLNILRTQLPRKQLAIFVQGLILGKMSYLFPILSSVDRRTLRPLEVAWRRALRCITGLLPSTPVGVLYAEAGFPPVELLIRRACGNYLIRLLTRPNLTTLEYLNWDGSHELWTPFGGLWQQQRRLPQHLLHPHRDFYGIEQMELPHWRMLDSLHGVRLKALPTREIALQHHKQGKLCEQGTHIMWTDGGYHHASREGTAGVIIETPQYCTQRVAAQSKFYPVGSSYEAECHALLAGLKVLAFLPGIRNAEVAIHTDSRSLVTHLESLQRRPRAATRTVNAMLFQISTLFRLGVSSISVTWTPGHAGIGCNDDADRRATEAMNNLSRELLSTSAACLRQSVRKNARKDLTDFLSRIIAPSQSQDAPPRFWYTLLAKGRPQHETPTEARVMINRRVEIAIARLRSGHTLTASHLHRIGIAAAPH